MTLSRLDTDSKPPLSKQQFNAEVKKINEAFDASERSLDNFRYQWCVGCVKVAEILNRGIEGIDAPTAYLAVAIHRSTQQARRLRRFGEVVKVIGSLVPDIQPLPIGRGAEDGTRRWFGPSDPKSKRPIFTEGQLRPLAGLLTESPEQVPAAFEAALKLAGKEPLTGTHVEAAVRHAKGLPERTQGGKNAPLDEQPDTPDDERPIYVPVEPLEAIVALIAQIDMLNAQEPIEDVCRVLASFQADLAAADQTGDLDYLRLKPVFAPP